MPEAPAISVVIPAYNAADTVGEQIEALLTQQVDVPFEVVLADNGSTDATAQVIRDWVERDGRVRFVDASQAPKGGAAAKNWGVNAARAPLLAFCDADDLVAPGWLQLMHDAVKEHRVAVCTREYETLNDGAVAPAQTGYMIGKIPGISGGAFAMERSLYLDLGGFDESFRGAVDTEFAGRVFKATGVAPVEVPDAVIHIRVPMGLGSRFRRSRALARSLPELEKRFPDLMPNPIPTPRKIAWLVRNAHWLASRDRRISWVAQSGRTIGTIEGRRAVRRPG